jgi:competence protein ComEA
MTLADDLLKPDEGNTSFFKQYKIPLILGAGSIIAIVISVVLVVKSTQSASPIKFVEADDSTIGQNASLITVDVRGAVVRPGVYKVPTNSRIDDAITSAGGLSEQADSNWLAKNMNRAARVVDGGKIYIPSIDETIMTHNNGFATSGTNFGLTSQNQGGVVATSGKTAQNTAINSLVSINNASEAELDSLSGVGPVTAQKIINNRPYQTLEELVSKKAVGQSLFNKIKDQLTL